MEPIDAKVEQQVWQRVRGREEDAGKSQEQDLRMLTLRAMEAGADYRHLAGMLTGGNRELARRLWENQSRIVACLRGMARLTRSPAGKAKTLEPSKDPAEKVLRRRYHQARKAVTEYAARGLDPQLGLVFRALSQWEEGQCALIAQLLGLLP